MKKQEAMERIEALRAEVDRLEAIINAPGVTSLLPVEPGQFRVLGHFGQFYAVPVSSSGSLGQNHFPDLATAQAYADAFSTMLELRRQPGSEPVKEDSQWRIEVDTCCNELLVTYSRSLNYKLSRISPCFATQEQAQAAVKAVGKGRILAMFKTLHGVTE